MSKPQRIAVTGGEHKGRRGKLIKPCSGDMADWAGVLLDGDKYPAFIKRSDIEFTEGE